MDLLTAVKICVKIALNDSPNSSKVSTFELLDQEYDPEMATISKSIAVALNNTISVEVLCPSTSYFVEKIYLQLSRL